MRHSPSSTVSAAVVGAALSPLAETTRAYCAGGDSSPQAASAVARRSERTVYRARNARRVRERPHTGSQRTMKEAVLGKDPDPSTVVSEASRRRVPSRPNFVGAAQLRRRCASEQRRTVTYDL